MHFSLFFFVHPSKNAFFSGFLCSFDLKSVHFCFVGEMSVMLGTILDISCPLENTWCDAMNQRSPAWLAAFAITEAIYHFYHLLVFNNLQGVPVVVFVKSLSSYRQGIVTKLKYNQTFQFKIR